MAAKKKTKTMSEGESSVVATVNQTWTITPRPVHPGIIAITGILQQKLAEPDANDPTKTKAEVFVESLIKNAIDGNATAINTVVERIEGKVPQTSLNVSTAFNDEERASRILSLLGRSGNQGPIGLPEPAGESGA